MSGLVSQVQHPRSLAEETAFIRRIPGDLRTIKDTVDAAQKEGRYKDRFLNDKMTQDISLWVNLFLAAFDKAKERTSKTDPATLVEHQITLLREEFLVDPLTQQLIKEDVHLDDEAVLGNDGKTYGYQSLSLCLNDPVYSRQFPAGFQVIPHTVVRCIGKWLKDRKEYRSSAQLDIKYKTFLEGGAKRIMVPMESPLARRLQLHALEELYAARNPAQVPTPAALVPYEQIIKESNQKVEQKAALAEIAKNTEALTQTVKTEVEKMQKDADKQVKPLNQTIGELQTDINQLQEQNAGHHKQLQEIDQNIASAQADALLLQIAINNAAIADKKRKKARIKAIAIAAALVATGIALELEIIQTPKGLMVGGKW